MTWSAWFAWFPVRTLSGRLAWLREVERKWDWGLNSWGDSSGHSGTDGGYVYRLPLTRGSV